ncbi:Spx/MgsR family RNA polymerase-binding regulatory protein [Gracilibacillus salitolerans]|uniref:Spx/MgsR family RNA polymerase-binding regulatory protein n=1 Tax=Gracilibacillus salitolerans TaxID=2663022 RepID=A0A5Q2TJ85_9BACI|nr:arsenate reductase family protein [Gracilibacillus salitolerans]QGH34197.1 Spx/MgsR family RNA polymerase-binding regulatory protein [Gracilibacillus salitolerans]
MTVQFYWYPKCGTCRKAKKWLDEHQVDYEAIHIVDNPPSKAELKSIIDKSGLPYKKFFNTSGKKYRELGLKDKLKDATEDEMLDYLTSDGMLLKRPLSVGEDQVTIGYKEETFEQTWN